MHSPRKGGWPFLLADEAVGFGMVKAREVVEGIEHALQGVIDEAFVAETVSVGMMGAHLLEDLDEPFDVFVAFALIGERGRSGRTFFPGGAKGRKEGDCDRENHARSHAPSVKAHCRKGSEFEGGTGGAVLTRELSSRYLVLYSTRAHHVLLVDVRALGEQLLAPPPALLSLELFSSKILIHIVLCPVSY